MFFANVGRTKNDAKWESIDFFLTHSEREYRPYCPCCENKLQIVKYPNSVKPHFFRHMKRTPQTDDCEIRVTVMSQSSGLSSRYISIDR